MKIIENQKIKTKTRINNLRKLKNVIFFNINIDSKNDIQAIIKKLEIINFSIKNFQYVEIKGEFIKNQKKDKLELLINKIFLINDVHNNFPIQNKKKHHI